MEDNLTELYKHYIHKQKRLVTRLNSKNKNIKDKSCYGVRDMSILEGQILELDTTIDNLADVLKLKHPDLPYADTVDLSPLYRQEATQNLINKEG